MIPQLKLAELLCTRLCHDLAGPVGAMANGAEFMQEEGVKMHEQAMDLISTSAAQAIARLQFYRRAYGRINENGEASIEELKKATSDFFAGGKVTVDWPDVHTDSSGVSISYKMGRLVFNLIIIAAATLLRGGTIAVRLSANDATKSIHIQAAGKMVKWDKEIEDSLSGLVALEALTPKLAQAYMSRLLAEELNTSLSWQVAEESITLVAYRKL